MAYSRYSMLLIFILATLAVVEITNALQVVLAQESGQEGGQVVYRRVEIWGLFYRNMIAAFMVGVVVNGLGIYICWRFRESNKRWKKITGGSSSGSLGSSGASVGSSGIPGGIR